MNWWKDLGLRIRFKEPLKKHTTFKIGGPAEFFIQPKDIRDLKLILLMAKKYKIQILLIGRGSNILAGDKGVKAMVLSLGSNFFKKIALTAYGLEAGSGLMLRELIQDAGRRGLSGLEFLLGIPGTVGGALAMNAGCAGKGIGDLVYSVGVMDYAGRVKVLKKKDMKFSYRSSSLSKYIILNAVFRLSKGNKKEVSGRIKKYLGYRRATQDLSRPNAGSIFKNPPQEAAGRLIDLCGLKGKRIGGAYISEKHANFILNKGQAKAADVLKLMGLIKKSVKNKFKVSLEPEIKIWQ